MNKSLEKDLTADVVVVGAGAVGSMMAWQLAQKGVKVLLIDAGPRIERANAIQHFFASAEKGPNSPYPSQPYAPHPMHPQDHLVQAGPAVFGGSYLRGVGGTTWHWTGFSARFRPNDFRTKSLFGVGVDWPVGYADLQELYLFVEKQWGTAGDSAFDQGGPRGGAPFPLPKVPMTYADTLIRDALAPLGYTVAPFAHARNSEVFDGRPACCGSSSCAPICPIGAKYDASVHVAKAEAAGVRVVSEALVEHIEVGPDQLVTGLRVRGSDGQRAVATGRAYVIAAHAIETPSLLLRSAQANAPQGVANRSDAVGRYLMGQVDLDTRALTREPIYTYRAPTTTAGVLELRDGPTRSEHGAIGTSFLNRGWRTALGPMQRSAHLIRAGLRGTDLARRLSDECARELAINTSVETLPSASNRVVPDAELRDASGMPRPRIQFTIEDYTLRGIEKARERHAAITKALACTDIETDTPSVASAIIAGTARMGTDVLTSVVDPFCRSHDHANLFIVGTANFPTMPINAPTLTAVALGLRALPSLQADLTAGRFPLSA
ncbi:FAD-dependent oxidoreductase [Curvibacter lanceolatus]|jgi:choline dehydrogenase-like flavoprotein|uniref:FAD-dependent oxidoreductase n=1 Tax=Curvibacter lanceolatus TaxID=86182 RepID=UPI000382EEE7|nr:GMC family oxidoreductase [Curvibacter lanceolatus]